MEEEDELRENKIKTFEYIMNGCGNEKRNGWDREILLQEVCSGIPDMKENEREKIGYRIQEKDF